MTIRLKHYIPAAAWLLIITGLSVTPGMQLPKFDLFSTDKLGHLAGYGLLTALLLWGYYRSNGFRAGWRTGLLIFAFASGYGCLMEFVQGAFIPGRFYEVDDMIANAAGAALVWLLAGTRLFR
ncbi:MAG: VanZ family protein [Saprospiraceae bacterium]|nr:VanZ family protein [Saprospiraceae bacterium]